MTTLAATPYDRAYDGGETFTVERMDPGGDWVPVEAFAGEGASRRAETYASDHRAAHAARGSRVRFRACLSRTTHAWEPK